MSAVFKHLAAAAEAGLGHAGTYFSRGAKYAAGAEPLSLTQGGGSTWAMFGTHFANEVGSVGSRIVGGPGLGLNRYSAGVVTSGVVGMGFSGAMLYEGYSSGGVGGVMSAAGTEIAVGAAMARYGYKYKMAGKGVGAVMTQSGIKGGFLGFMARTASAYGVAGAASAMVGGGPLGMVAGAAGAVIGAKAGVPIMAGYLGYQAAKLGGSAVMATLKPGREFRQNQRSLHTSGSLAAFNTHGAQTMRSRAVQAINKSHLNARSALGSEANYMHFPSRNYHSRYRGAY